MDRPTLAVLLRAVDRGVRRLTPEDLLDVDRWLHAEPDLSAAALRAGLASLLARDDEEWRRVARLVEQFTAGRLDDAGVTAVTEAPEAAEGPVPVRRVYRPDAPMPPVVGALVAAGRTGRLVVLSSSLVVAVLVLISAPTWTEQVAEVVVGVTGGGGGPVTAPPVVEASQQAWRFVEREAARVATARLPVSLGWRWTLVMSAASVALAALGLRWRRLAGEAGPIEARREQQRNEEAKALEAAWVKAGAPALHLFAVDPPPPLADRTLADAAALLGRLRVTEPTPELDVERTADRTARRAGRVDEVYVARAVALPPVVLLDLGPGDHPWRLRMERMVLACRRLGVALDLFVFREHDPGTVYRYEDREPFELSELGRRTEGRPLVVLSPGLSARAIRGAKAWVKALPAWPARVWLDPEPRPPDARRAAEVADVEQRGLKRFPFHDGGVLAALRYLLGGAPAEAPPPVAAPVADAQRFAVWALAAAHVPDPTWDQLESFRAGIPQLAAWFPDPSHVAWLVDWVEAQPESDGVALRSGGDGVAVSPALADRLLRQWRAAAAAEPWLREMASQVDALLLAQLSRKEPAPGTWEHAVWALKVAWIRARLHPEQAFLQLAPVLEGPLRRAAVELLRGELARQRDAALAGFDWRVEAREALTDAVGEEPRVAWSSLLGWPARRSAAVGLGAALALWAVAVFGMNGWATAPASVAWEAMQAVERGERRTVEAHGMTFVEIPAGSFWMGSPATEDGRDGDESRHRVTLTRPFLLATTEVTQGLYREVVGSLPDCSGGERQPGDMLPMHCVSWDDAVSFAAKLSALDGLPEREGYRLPTEAEWEYAARAGTDLVYAGTSDVAAVCSFGNVADAAAKAANPSWTTFNCDDGYAGLAPVAAFRPNVWGLYDMTGNVWEWTADWYTDDYGGDTVDPRGPPRAAYRAVRGGSFGVDSVRARVAERSWLLPSEGLATRGFRLARSLPSALSPSDPPPAPATE